MAEETVTVTVEVPKWLWEWLQAEAKYRGNALEQELLEVLLMGYAEC